MAAAALVLVGSYVLGTFPSAVLVGRHLGFDPTTEGSGNPGATNSTRVGGWKAGAAVLLADVAKGAIAAGTGLLVGDLTLAWAAGLAAVAGHLWPVTRRFRGGKGVATGAGAVLVCAPVVAVLCGLVFAVLVKTTKVAAIGSIAMAVLVPIGVAVAGQDPIDVLLAALLGSLVVLRHQDNIRRLISGEESTVSGTSGDAP